MASVHAELAKAQKEVIALQAAMAKAAVNPAGTGLDTKFLNQYARAAADARATLLRAVGAQGDFAVQSMKVASHTDTLTERLKAQKFGLRDLITEHKNLGDVYRKQMALQKSMVMQWSRNGNGTINADMFTRIPQQGEKAARSFREVGRQAGFYNQVLSSVSDNTVKWGKNTQWAGRQLMAGLSMPIAAAAAATGVLAYQVDKGLTQVVKVYGDAATAATTTDAEIKQATMNTARQMASSYGQSVQDTIEVTSQLAAAGKTGGELQKATAEVTRARTLGELNLQDAMKATITLQSVYGMSSQKLGETFNFMNSMENQTNLTMQDFVVGIPKVSGVLKEFGGTVQDAGVLLAGMKAAGIDAAEGANAIKSISFKIISPNQGSKDMFEQLTGASFDQTMQGADGVVERLQVLGKAMKGLTEEQRVGLIQKMFGLYQGSKALSLLSQLTDGSEQMTRAFEVAQQGAAGWADTANRELSKLQNSGWNKIKQQWETMKIELADIGKTFLAMATPIAKFFNGILQWFNQLPQGAKHFILVGAAITAMIGPLIMLAGLIGNLIGNVGKFTTFIAGLALRFKILNSEEQISNLLAKQAQYGINAEAAAYANLGKQISAATASLEVMNAARLQSNYASISQPYAAQRKVIQSQTGTPVVLTAKGRVRPAGKKEQAAQYARDYDEAHALNAARPASADIADNSARAERSWKNISTSSKAYAVAGAAGVASMVAPTGSILSNIANIALIGGTIAPLVGRIGLVTRGMTALGGAARSAGAKVASGLAPATRPIAAMGRSIVGFLPALAPIAGVFAGIGVAAAAAFYIINKNISQTRKESEQLADSAKSYADVLGFSYAEAGKRIDEQGNAVLSFDQKVAKFRETNEGAAKIFADYAEKGVKEQQKLNDAIAEGMKALNHGASPEQAMEAAKIALRAMGSTLSESQLEVAIEAKINFSDAKAVAKRQMEDIKRIMARAISPNGYSQGKSESFARWFTGREDINVNAAEQIKGQAREMWTIFANADEKEQSKVFEQIRKNAMAHQIETFNALKEQHAKEFAAQGINTANDLARFTAQGGSLNTLGMNMDQINNWRREMDSVSNMIVEFGTKAGISEDKLKKMLDFSQMREQMPWLKDAASTIQTVAQSEKQWKEFIDESKNSIVKWTDAEKLARLNLYRRRAGLEDAKSIEQGFGEEIKKTTTAMEEQARVTARLKAAQAAPTGMAGAGINGVSTNDASALTSTMKEAYSGAMNDIYDEAARTMDDQNQAVMDGIKARGDKAKEALDREQDQMEARFDRQNKAFDSRWDTRMKNFDKKWDNTMDAFDKKWDNRKKTIESSYDAQIEKIQKTIEAEQDAEKVRQQIFEAEKTRIQRLSDLYNRSVDINAAIAGGNLDQAAKLTNDYTSTQEGWMLQDSADSADQGQQAREKQLNARIDVLEKAKSARLERLQEEQDAEKRALEATKEREKEMLETRKATEKDAMDYQQKMEQKSLESRKKALDKKLQAEEKTAQRAYEANKRALDKELAALKAHVPQNEAQLAAHIKRVEGAYSNHGVVLQRKGTQWGKVVGNALKDNVHTATVKMSNDISWAGLGKVAAEEMAKGAFNMTLSQFMKWVTTGEVPSGYKAGGGYTGGAVQKTKSGRWIMREAGTSGGSTVGGTTRHKGGLIDGTKGSRAGFAGNGLSQSEVMVRALKGEAVLNRQATRTLGTDFVEMANKGMIPKNIGGPDLLGGAGLSGIMGMMMAGAIRKSMETGILNAGAVRQQMEAAAAYSAGGTYMGPPLHGFEAFFQAIAAQESGGNYRAVNGSTGALGKYQILPSNVGPWGMKYLGQNITPNQFLMDSGLQDKLARAVLSSYYASYGPRGAASAWYSGDPSLSESTRPQAGYPSIKAYVDSIMAKMASFGQTAAFPAAVGGWVRPAAGPRTSPYGYRIHPITGERKLHAGSDIGAPGGAPIHAARAGKVVFAGWNNGYGNYTIIDHGSGVKTAYAHQSRFAVRSGAQVQAGQTIGYVGTTGASTGNHLHFEYMLNGQRLNPGLIIPGLKTGGFTLSDGLAQLHKGETVVTAPLTQKLKDGINNMDKSQHFGYNVNMNFDGAHFDSQIDFERGVENALLAIERRRGPSRRIGGK
jgi:TP901 family phage tail tape measure protein